MQDSEIIELYLSRSERAIDETACKYGNYCNKIAYNILKDGFDAEECVNDTYLKTWNSIPPAIPKVFSAFLAKITRNIALDRYRQATAEKRSAKLESFDELSECVGTNEGDTEYEITELGEIISNFLRHESELSRRIFISRYFFENSIDEISKKHGITVGYAKTTLHRTRVKLKEFLKKEGVWL